jgi:DNA adenine methylase
MNTPNTRLPGPLKWHGGKSYLAGRIVSLMPEHLHYVEPFAGGLSVLLAKDPEGVSEVVNDLDGGLSNFWQVLQGEDTFSRFARILDAMPFSGIEWRRAGEVLDQGEADLRNDPVAWAVAFFVHCRQSLAGLGYVARPGAILAGLFCCQDWNLGSSCRPHSRS